MNWLPLTDDKQLDELVTASYQKPVAIYKHSTRCSVSVMVKRSLEQQWLPSADIPVYYLDLLAYRPVSNRIADVFGVEHQSPQLILVKNGKAVYDASHSEVDFEEMVAHI